MVKKHQERTESRAELQSLLEWLGRKDERSLSVLYELTKGESSVKALADSLKEEPEAVRHIVEVLMSRHLVQCSSMRNSCYYYSVTPEHQSLLPALVAAAQKRVRAAMKEASPYLLFFQRNSTCRQIARVLQRNREGLLLQDLPKATGIRKSQIYLQYHKMAREDLIEMEKRPEGGKRYPYIYIRLRKEVRREVSRALRQLETVSQEDEKRKNRAPPRRTSQVLRDASAPAPLPPEQALAEEAVEAFLSVNRFRYRHSHAGPLRKLALEFAKMGRGKKDIITGLEGSFLQ